MPIKIRKYKNQKRGTELPFATIPIKDIRNSREIKDDFSENPNYNPSAKENMISQLKHFYGDDIDSEKAIDNLQGFVYKGSEEEKERFQQRKPPKPPREILIELKLKGANDNWAEMGGSISHYLNVKRIGKKLLITPAPVIHNIMGHRDEQKMGRADRYIDAFKVRKQSGKTQFDDLLNILKEGFESHDFPEENSYVKGGKKHRINYRASGGGNSAWKNEGITKGDIFSLEMFPKEGFSKGRVPYPPRNKNGPGEQTYRVIKASPENISSVNIQLAEGATEEEKQKKMEFYEEQLKSFDMSHRFFTVIEDEKGNPIYKRVFPEKSNLEKRVLSIIGITGISLGLFFLSPIITGNVISNISNSTSNWIGAVLLGIGLIAGFFRLKK